MSTSATQPNVLTGHDGLVVSVVKAFYQVLSNVTHTIGLTPLQLAEGIGAMVLALLLYVMLQGLRGKTNFSIDPKDTRKGSTPDA